MSFKKGMKEFKGLTSRDFRVLLAIEAGMSAYKFVPTQTIEEYSSLPPSEARLRLERVHQLKLIRRWTGQYIGYTLNSLGYDFLAMNALVKGSGIAGLGHSLGVGKEADVFEAITDSDTNVALKFHRLGRVSFRQTKRHRDYSLRQDFWLFRSREAAGKEYEALKRLYEVGVSVPEPIAHNRHAIVMSMIQGVKLSDFDRLPRPKFLLLKVLENVRKALDETAIVHGDLSEFNVILEPDGRVLIIDWPQYVTQQHIEWKRLLLRDIRNIVTFFRRKHGVDLNPDEAVKMIVGKGRVKEIAIL
ncbi:MAG: RIO1 family regulatory kinase/ATPase [Candidatus Bathyarchaeia archaeon]